METLKSKLRKEALKIRDNITNRNIKSELISSHFLNSELFKNSIALSSYVSFKSEVDTSDIISKSLSLNKEIFTPKVISNNELKLYLIKSLSDLEIGSFGILEPKESLTEYITTEDITAELNPKLFDLSLILIPGLAFDLSGNRIGYGKGHYDRLLSKLSKTCIKIGLAFKEQIYPSIPTEELDIKMDYLISEDGFIEC